MNHFLERRHHRRQTCRVIVIWLSSNLNLLFKWGWFSICDSRLFFNSKWEICIGVGRLTGATSTELCVNIFPVIFRSVVCRRCVCVCVCVSWPHRVNLVSSGSACWSSGLERLSDGSTGEQNTNNRSSVTRCYGWSFCVSTRSVNMISVKIIGTKMWFLLWNCSLFGCLD